VTIGPDKPFRLNDFFCQPPRSVVATGASKINALLATDWFLRGLWAVLIRFYCTFRVHFAIGNFRYADGTCRWKMHRHVIYDEPAALDVGPLTVNMF
jgi:hypothetical protein